MNPVYNTICATLEEAGLLTHEAAEALAKHMQGNIHESRYEDALRMVQKVSKKEELQFSNEPWMLKIHSLERRVEELEAKLEAKTLQTKKKIV